MFLFQKRCTVYEKSILAGTHMNISLDLQALHRLEQAVVDDDGKKMPKETLIATNGLYVTKFNRDVGRVFWLTYGKGTFKYVF
jgi:hypothetical protein